MSILVTCKCGKKLQVRDELAGKRGKCPACGQALAIPAPAPPAGKGKASPPTSKKCPSCQATLQPNAVLCVDCGLDLRTGQKFAATNSATDLPDASPESSLKPMPKVVRNALIFGGIGGALVVAAVVFYLLVLRTTPFEKAFAAGRISWEPISNIQITTEEGKNRTIQSYSFAQKIEYDEFGRGTVNKEGLKTYKWGSRETTFGPTAVIKITKGYKVAEGELKAGDEWVWDGSKWGPKKQ